MPPTSLGLLQQLGTVENGEIILYVESLCFQKTQSTEVTMHVPSFDCRSTPLATDRQTPSRTTMKYEVDDPRIVSGSGQWALSSCAPNVHNRRMAGMLRAKTTLRVVQWKQTFTERLVRLGTCVATAFQLKCTSDRRVAAWPAVRERRRGVSDT